MESSHDFGLPYQVWYTLKECCEKKNLNYSTALNRKYLQPNSGVPDGEIGGKRVWKRATVLEWINKTDSELLDEKESKIDEA